MLQDVLLQVFWQQTATENGLAAALGTSVEKTYSTMFVHAHARKFREKTYTPTPMVVNKLNIKRISGCRLRCRKAEKV